MSKTLTQVVTYSAGEDSLSIALEQEPVAGNELTTDDLAAMLSMVRNGISARLYKPDSCDVKVIDGEVMVSLYVYAWPYPLDWPYTFRVNFGTADTGIPYVEDREFDFLIDFSRKTALPFQVSKASIELTDMPFFDSNSNVVPAPTITVDDRYVYVDADVLGVVRVKCTAVGFMHTIKMKFTPEEDTSLSDFKFVAAVNYKNKLNQNQTTSLQLELPGCLEQLLATCDDDLLYDTYYGSTADDDQIPVVYFSDCDGTFLGVRYEDS